MLVAFAPAAGCGDSAAPQPPARSGAAAIDEVAGTFRGAGIGDTRHTIEQKLGRPESVLGPNSTEPWTPVGYGDGYDLGLPGYAARSNAGSKTRPTGLRYRGAAFTLISGFGAYRVAVAVPGAATKRGVAIGDPLDEAKKAYPDLECGIQNEDSEYPEFPYCTGQVAADRYIWFGEDPIGSITVTVCPMSGPDFVPCRPER